MAVLASNVWNALRKPRRLILIAGPCVIESADLCFRVAARLTKLARQLGLAWVFKASFDKANRTSAATYRGPGPQAGLEILGQVRRRFQVPVLTDIHTVEQAEMAAPFVDVLQIPAFLCRQTDLVQAAVRTGRIVNLKKGQFLSPAEMKQVIQKAVSFGGKRLLVTERGTTFGYHNLVADMRAIPLLRESGFPVVFDATHSVQLPGAGGDRSSGQGHLAPVLARAAVAAGADGVFIETHPDPARALSDGANMIALDKLGGLLRSLVAIRAALR